MRKCVIFDVADSQVARQVVNQACNVPGKWDMFPYLLAPLYIIRKQTEMANFPDSLSSILQRQMERCYPASMSIFVQVSTTYITVLMPRIIVPEDFVS